MVISKPIRQICCLIIGLALSGLCALILLQFLGKLGIFIGFFLYPVFNVVGGMPIDNLDRWLRRKTRDRIWLMTDEGREWLNSEEGQVWQQKHQNDNY
jgi:hypothetical protein